MPSLHQLWKSLPASQSRLRIIFTRLSSSNSKALPSPVFGESFQDCHSSTGSSSSFGAFQFESTGSFGRASEVAEQVKPLSASEALTRFFATPSIHGPVWQSFGHNQSQVPFENNYTAPRRQVSEWKKLASKFSTPWNVKSLKIEEFHPGFKIVHQSEAFDCPKLSCVCEHEEDNTGNDKDSEDKETSDATSELESLLSTSLAFHAIRAGPCLPAVNELFQNALHSATVVGVAAAKQLELMLDSSPEDENFEVKDKCTDGDLNTKGLRLLSGACCIPHPEKESSGGEDAYFICSDKGVIGVADGVGGWADVGVDAGEYARQLMNQSLIAARQEPRGCVDTARVLEIAHSKTYCRGSSTACILALSNHGLQAANLGDSGFLVVRNGRVIFKSPAQQHNFNFPFQLESGGGDPPTAAQVFTVEVASGDVIVAGTDGLFDNLFDTELTSIVMQSIRSGFSPDITAQKIAALARERAQDCNRQTPFSAAAQDAGFRFYGGKMDDITVIVSYVTSDI